MAAHSPFGRLGVAFAIVFANMALAFGAAPIRFIPSSLAVSFGIAYGAICAAYHAYAARQAAIQMAELTESQRQLLSGALTSKGVVGLTVIQLVFGIGAFTDGAGALYTRTFGHAGDATHVVASVRLKTRPQNCFKHRLAELSAPLNVFYGPCLEIGYPPGSRVIYHGQESALGFEYDSRTVESNGAPARLRTSD